MQGVATREGGNATSARTHVTNNNEKNTNKTPGERTKKKTTGEIASMLNEYVKKAIQSVRGLSGVDETRASLMSNLESTLRLVQELAHCPEGGKSEFGLIMQRLDRMEKSLSTPGQPEDPRKPGKALWSEIAAGSKSRATLEVRMEPGEEGETMEAKLQRVKKAIPEARALIPHPRAKGKISVVIPSTARRDQLMNTGIGDHEGIRLIRRPRQVMIMGLPLTTNITHSNSAENKEWTEEANRKNAVTITRVGWLYSAKRLEKIRKAGSQTKGSLIIEVATEEDQNRILREGFLHGPLWLPTKKWDIGMKSTQCFKCWKWGHTQSVCNSPEEYCGFCAGQHATKECQKQGIEDSRCAACKKPGHRAWMSMKCPAHKENWAKQKALEAELNRSTVSAHHRIQADNPASQLLWTTVGNKRKRIGRPLGLSVAGEAPGQTKLFPSSGRSTPLPQGEEAEMEIDTIIQNELAQNPTQ
ncbi:hypothetical protein K402DRAFT_418761 [Aulographum hederae CBS 113979]|uniref:CCHC-type domain-containing protein n=2 Tax=Aulographum hederae CBS 113979 TaxID=1176131 RepID=A0A6G1H8W8_9PEZI|nr:hypothetical protein K402DRAFT_418761 [Aulographum hederae CBS 113979]